MRILTVSYRRSVIVIIAAVVFLSSIAALYRHDAPRTFQTQVYKYTEYYQGTSAHRTSESKKPIASSEPESSGGLGKIYTSEAEWVAQKAEVAKGKVKERLQPDYKKWLKEDEKRLMVCFFFCLERDLVLGDLADSVC